MHIQRYKCQTSDRVTKQPATIKVKGHRVKHARMYLFHYLITAAPALTGICFDPFETRRKKEGISRVWGCWHTARCCGVDLQLHDTDFA
jgi:hypothetical protein